MSQRQVVTKTKHGIFHPASIILMLLCVIINVLLLWTVRMMDLPFNFDTVGTIIASAIGGLLPGIITAFSTSVISLLLDGEAMFFAPLNMIVAILSAIYFGEYSKYLKRRFHREDTQRELMGGMHLDRLLFVLVLAFIGGGLKAGISWYLYEAPSDLPLIVSISAWLSEHFGLGVFGCHLASAFITDVIDKTASVFAAVMLMLVIPAKIKNYVKVSLWKQTPLTLEERDTARHRTSVVRSLGFRINMILIISTFLMMIVALAYGSISYRDNTTESMAATATQIAYLASKEIDPALVETFLENGYSAPGYIETKDRLSVLKNSSKDIAFLYVYKIDEEGCHVIFDLDTVLSDGSFVKGDSPGMTLKYEESYLPYLDDLLAGRQLPEVRMEDDYGSFISAFCPVYDSNGRCLCYAVTNIESSRIGVLQDRYFGRVLLLFAGFFIIIVIISVVTTRYHVVMPILSMTIYANEMTDSKGGANEESLEKIEELDIRTGDEMEQLYRALCKLTGDTVYQLNDNKNKSEAISKMQNALIITMADMVESRDSDTGAHVLKTAAYVRIILQGLRSNGYYTEKITDKYMRDVEMSAPLHDVGKINIPDAILNKPGKLTPEEFEIMKSHTTSGQKILDNAISSMEGDNYLKEARNMAAYHHERWDGKGYPEGLHGEVIPLSARVMAVADVFDAVSSQRVYKPAFPFEESVQIIKDGAGTQFDPKVVEVFVGSVSEVKKVFSKYQEI